MTKNIVLDLKARKDKANKTYYIAKVEAPMTIDLKDGAVFLVFVSEEGAESLQIGKLEKGKDHNSNFHNNSYDNDDDDRY